MKIFDYVVEAACWLGIAVVILITLDVMKAEVTYNRMIADIPPITMKGE